MILVGRLEDVADSSSLLMYSVILCCHFGGIILAESKLRGETPYKSFQPKWILTLHLDSLQRGLKVDVPTTRVQIKGRFQTENHQQSRIHGKNCAMLNEDYADFKMTKDPWAES
jgi:hypothetical protein